MVTPEINERPKLRTPEHRMWMRQTYNEIKDLLKEGLTIKEAAERVGVTLQNYSNWRTKFEPNSRRAKLKKLAVKTAAPARSHKRPKVAAEKQPYIEIPLTQPSQGVAVIVCQPSQLREVLEVLK